jgi:hypothetical protein
MGMMTVSACRNSPGFLFPELSFDDLEMNLFNPGMTFGACGGDVSR